MQDILLVVARFEENVKWLNDVALKTIVYNKGESNIPKQPNNITVINNVKNVGREGETYLKHIVDHYEELSDYIVFTQAEPFEHYPEFKVKLGEMAESGFAESIRPMSLRWRVHMPPRELYTPFDKTWYLETASRFTYATYLHWDIGVNSFLNSFKYFNPKRAGTDIFHQFCEMIHLDDPMYRKTIWFNFFYSGCFAVKRESVLKHPRSFYEDCLKLIRADYCYGYMFERIWWHMFGGEHVEPDPQKITEMY